MENNSLAGQVVRLRKDRGLSQDKLADLASINLRTLQRIEKGETEPRGDTLRLIATALEVPIENLFCSQERKDRPDKEDAPEKEDKGFLQFMNLSALAYWIFPLGNIFLPLLLWYLKKDQVKGAKELGKRIVNFQLTWSFVTFFLLAIAISSSILHLPISPSYIWIILPVFLIGNSALILLASFQLIGGKEKIFSASLKIIR